MARKSKLEGGLLPKKCKIAKAKDPKMILNMGDNIYNLYQHHQYGNFVVFFSSNLYRTYVATYS